MLPATPDLSHNHMNESNSVKLSSGYKHETFLLHFVGSCKLFSLRHTAPLRLGEEPTVGI